VAEQQPHGAHSASTFVAGSAAAHVAGLTSSSFSPISPGAGSSCLQYTKIVLPWDSTTARVAVRTT